MDVYNERLFDKLFLYGAKFQNPVYLKDGKNVKKNGLWKIVPVGIL